MRTLLIVVAVVAIALALFGVFVEALRWLIIVGLIVAAASIIASFVTGRRSVGGPGRPSV